MRLAVLVGSLILSLAAPAAALERPALSMRSSGTRIIVRGTHFASNERVTVRVIGRTVSRTRTVTTAGGSFRVSLPRPAPRACNTLVVRASGARGDWAVLRIGSPECNPPGWRLTP
jgi:hypothetical protein